MENEMIEEILLILDDKLEKAVSVLKEDYAAIRAGRANPHILDKVTVDYYGAMTPVTQIPCYRPLGYVGVKGYRKGYTGFQHRLNAHQRRQGYKAGFPRADRGAPPRPC